MARGRIRFLVVAIAFLLVGCATMPPQVRPYGPDAFVGNWDGYWQSSVRTGSGGAHVTIEQITRPAFAVFRVSLTSAVVSDFGDEARFENGELIVDRQNFWLRFKLRGANLLEVNYENRRSGDKGNWWLERQK